MIIHLLSSPQTFDMSAQVCGECPTNPSKEDCIDPKKFRQALATFYQAVGNERTESDLMKLTNEWLGNVPELIVSLTDFDDGPDGGSDLCLTCLRGTRVALTLEPVTGFPKSRIS